MAKRNGNGSLWGWLGPLLFGVVMAGLGATGQRVYDNHTVGAALTGLRQEVSDLSAQVDYVRRKMVDEDGLIDQLVTLRDRQAALSERTGRLELRVFGEARVSRPRADEVGGLPAGGS